MCLPQPRPSLLALCIMGCSLGALQALQIMIFPDFVFMPITFGSLPFSVAAFVAGVMARKNGWLDEPLPAWEVVVAKVVASFIVTAAFVGFLVLYSQGGGLGFLSVNDCGERPDRGLYTDIGATVGLLLAMCVLGGVFVVCMLYCVLDIFRSYCNFRSNWSDFFCRVSYTAFIVHPVVVILFTAAFIGMVRSRVGRKALMADDHHRDIGYGDLVDCVSRVDRNGVVLFGGLLFVAIASLGVVYPLAALVRRLPGVSDIL